MNECLNQSGILNTPAPRNSAFSAASAVVFVRPGIGHNPNTVMHATIKLLMKFPPTKRHNPCPDKYGMPMRFKFPCTGGIVILSPALADLVGNCPVPSKVPVVTATNPAKASKDWVSPNMGTAGTAARPGTKAISNTTAHRKRIELHRVRASVDGGGDEVGCAVADETGEFYFEVGCPGLFPITPTVKSQAVTMWAACAFTTETIRDRLPPSPCRL